MPAGRPVPGGAGGRVGSPPATGPSGGAQDSTTRGSVRRDPRTPPARYSRPSMPPCPARALAVVARLGDMDTLTGYRVADAALNRARAPAPVTCPIAPGVAF